MQQPQAECTRAAISRSSSSSASCCLCPRPRSPSPSANPSRPTLFTQSALLGLTITAPLSLVLVPIPFFSSWQLGDLLLFRLFTIPVVLFVLVCSLLLTRFAHARRFIFYALLVEGLSLVACFAGMLFLMRR